MENTQLTFLMSLNARPSTEGGIGANPFGKDALTDEEGSGFFNILESMFANELDPSEIEAPVLPQAMGSADGLLENGELFLGHAGLEGEDLPIGMTSIAPLAEGSAPFTTIENGKLSMAMGDSALSGVKTADHQAGAHLSLDIEAGDAPDSVMENVEVDISEDDIDLRRFPVMQKGEAVTQMVQNGSIVKADVALPEGFSSTASLDADIAPSERSVSSRTEISNPFSAEKTISAAPVRDQIVAAVAARGAEGRIEIRLDPPELGRVSINFESDGAEIVRAVVSADAPDTLELMRRHTDMFHKALMEQGFDGLDLQFSEFASENDDQAKEETFSVATGSSETDMPEGAVDSENASQPTTILGRLDRRF